MFPAGLVVMSEDLEEIFRCINEARVPKMWSKAYPSQKPLGSWTRDLVQRVDQFFKWAHTGTKPLIFCLSYFTFPTGFLTAVLQTSARANSISVDTLSWEFIVQVILCPVLQDTKWQVTVLLCSAPSSDPA